MSSMNLQLLDMSSLLSMSLLMFEMNHETRVLVVPASQQGEKGKQRRLDRPELKTYLNA